ncbi:MAG: nucleotidyl transferase AbiEii/AbiGii toxin family protein [candidate division WOR-3 bacterium]|nr:nucleotidyl transferase AbiEii/AbiGii toxin family protein [candidate division WOR-3 bacterium]
MQNLIKQEQFEIEVLEQLHKNRILDKLVFGGGTMLRLCYGLNRFSVDLDFWLVKDLNTNRLFQTLKTVLGKIYTLTDAQNKYYTILFELKSSKYPRRLKIEIRKEKKFVRTEKAIAYSSYANTQVLLTVVALEEMMKSKIQAFIERREIRDVFDIEFLYKRGIALPQEKEILQKILDAIEVLPPKDYTVKLGSIISADLRKYYTQENFKILKLAIKERLGQ